MRPRSFVFVPVGMLLMSLVPAASVAAGAAPSLVERAAYLDAAHPIGRRVDDLLSRMTLQEKVGQMTMAERGAVTGDPAQVTTLMLGAVLSGGGSVPTDNTPAGWADMVDMFQQRALQTRLQIPILYGVDSVHGHGNLYGATVFPHNIGLGSTSDPKLIERIEHVVAEETRATGPQWSFAPCVCVARDARWGRMYESFSEDPKLVTRLSSGVRGFQGDNAGDLRDERSGAGVGQALRGRWRHRVRHRGRRLHDRPGRDDHQPGGLRADRPRAVRRGRATTQDGHRDAVLLERRLDRGRDRQPAEDARTPRADHRCTEEPDRVRRVRDLGLGGHPPDPRRLGDPGADRRERRDRHVHGAVLRPAVRDHPAGRGERRPGAHDPDRRRGTTHPDQEVRARPVRAAVHRPVEPGRRRIGEPPGAGPRGGREVAGAAEEFQTTCCRWRRTPRCTSPVATPTTWGTRPAAGR